jgi:hypothetical protein
MSVCSAIKWLSTFRMRRAKWWLQRPSTSPGRFSQGFDLPDARLMIASAMADLAELLLEQGEPLPTPNPDASKADAELIGLVPLSVHVGACRI